MLGITSRGLPAYLGGKRVLAPLIFALLSQHVERSAWSEKTFIDPFLGGGSVSLTAKALGFPVICNDLALRSAVVGRALIANSSVRLTEADVLVLLREPACAYRKTAQERFAPSVFSAAHACALDRALFWAGSDAFAEPKRSLARLLAIKWLLRVEPMSMLRGTDAKAAFSGDLDRVSSRRVGHYLRSFSLLEPWAWWRLAQEVNRGVSQAAARLIRPMRWPSSRMWRETSSTSTRRTPARHRMSASTRSWTNCSKAGVMRPALFHVPRTY